jgi:hypothetical protein
VMPPLVPWAHAPAVASDIRRIKLSLFMVRLGLLSSLQRGKRA